MRGRKSAAKPYQSFPPTPHKSGQFCKKIRGKTYYFGKIDDPEAAIRRYDEHAKGLHAGRIDHVDRSGQLTIAEPTNAFLAAKERHSSRNGKRPARRGERKKGPASTPTNHPCKLPSVPAGQSVAGGGCEPPCHVRARSVIDTAARTPCVSTDCEDSVCDREKPGGLSSRKAA